MLAHVETYKKRVRKQQEKEVPENREGPEEEPDSTAGLQLQAAAIELSDQDSLNDVGSEDQQQSRQVEGEAPPGSSRGNEDLVELFLPTPPTPDSTTAGLQLLAAAIELSERNSLNDVGSEDQQPSRQVEGEAPPGSSSRVKKNKFSSLPAPSKESLRRLLKRIDDETSSKDCKQEVVPMPRINATEEHDVLPPPPAPAPAPPALPPAAAVPVNDDYRIHVINRFVDLALGLYRQ
ncbi:hypothetical protein DMENIID0001_109180 [Sergentomyia squamirostris]